MFFYYRTNQILFLFTIFFLFLSNRNQGQHNEVISYRTAISVENQVLNVKVSLEIQINDRAGEDLTKISLPYTKSSKIKSLDAWIEDLKGNIIRKLDKKDVADISSISDFSLYEDDFVKKFELRHHEYPYKIFYRYEQNFDEFLQIVHWHPVFRRSVATRNAELTVLTDTAYKLSVFQEEIINYETDTVLNKVRRIWVANYPVPIKDEIYSPPFEEMVPKVMIVPNDFIYGIPGNATTWRSFGKWNFELNEGSDVLPEPEKNKIDKLVTGISDEKEIAKILYRYLQKNTRYINVSIDIGGLKTYPAEYVVKNRYGDCKALTNYMKAILEYKGIKSFYTPVLAGENEPQILQNIPGPQFNHVFLTIPFDEDTMWLECTSKYNPFGYYGTFTQNRYAFLLEKDNSRLIKIPGLTTDEIKKSSKTMISITTEGKCLIDYVSECRGGDFEELAEIKNQLNTSVQDDILKEYGSYFISVKNSVFNSWKIDIPNPDSAIANLVLDVTVPDFAKNYGEYLVFNLIGLGIPNFESVSERKLPVLFPYPINKTDTCIILPPQGYKMPDEKKFKTIPSNFGKYTIEFKNHKDHLEVIRHFELNAINVSVQSYPEFFSFIQSVKKEESMKLIFNKI